jgi:PAS domain S-box-containing protein
LVRKCESSQQTDHPPPEKSSATLGAEAYNHVVADPETSAHTGFRAVVDTLGDGVLILAADGKVQYANHRALELALPPGGALVGEPIADLWSTESRAEATACIDCVLTAEDSRTFQAPLRSSGRWVEVRVARLAGLPPWVAVATLHDVTERRRAAQALSETEERVRTFASLAVEGILIHERGKVVDVSQRFCDLIGRKAEELVGKSGVDAIGFTERSKKVVADSIKTKSTVPYEVEIVRPDGSIFYGETRGEDITHMGRQVRIVHMWDIGERRLVHDEREKSLRERNRLEESLRQAQKLESVGRLAGGVAHDFNNLLTVIGGNVALVLSDMPAADPLRELLAEVTQAVESASNLTRQLLTFSRKQVIDPKVVDLNAVVAELQKMLYRLLGEDIDFQTILDDGLGRTRVDGGQFEQILVNLAVNARDAMPDGGKLTIETANVDIDADYCDTHGEAKPGRYVMLAVSDNGTGMDAGVKEHLFEPFFTTKEHGKGTGLGLAMVYGAVRQHGGHIEVYTEPGRGTTFKVYLPRVDDPVDSVRRSPERAPRGNETVILVEDADALRMLAVRLLERQGYRVLAFRDGAEALGGLAALEGPAHLLLTDVVMPGMNGRVLAEQMATLRPGLKVLFTSGYTENVVVHHGVLKRGINFLPKPYTPEALAARVREALDG